MEFLAWLCRLSRGRAQAGHGALGGVGVLGYGRVILFKLRSVSWFVTRFNVFLKSFSSINIRSFREAGVEVLCGLRRGTPVSQSWSEKVIIWIQMAIWCYLDIVPGWYRMRPVRPVLQKCFSFTSRPPSDEVVTAPVAPLSAADKVKQRLAALRGDGLPVCWSLLKSVGCF